MCTSLLIVSDTLLKGRNKGQSLAHSRKGAAQPRNKMHFALLAYHCLGVMPLAHSFILRPPLPGPSAAATLCSAAGLEAEAAGLAASGAVVAAGEPEVGLGAITASMMMFSIESAMCWRVLHRKGQGRQAAGQRESGCAIYGRLFKECSGMTSQAEGRPAQQLLPLFAAASCSSAVAAAATPRPLPCLPSRLPSSRVSGTSPSHVHSHHAAALATLPAQHTSAHLMQEIWSMRRQGWPGMEARLSGRVAL